MRCNFSCSYCFTFSGPLEAKNSFLLDNWNKFLAECRVLLVPEIRLSGGEPLLIEDIERRCRAISEYGMNYALLTNGSLLDRHLTWLRAVPPLTLWLSYHREYSTVDFFAKKVARAADVLPRVGVHVFSRDLREKPGLVDRAVAAGAQRVKILSLTPVGRCLETVSDTLPREAVDVLVNRWKSISTGTLEVRFETPSVQGLSTGASTCVIRERPLLSIDHNGSVYPCCVTTGTSSTALGNLQNETFEAIVRRSKLPFRRLPCAEILPSIINNQSPCPLRLETLASAEKT